MRIRVVVGTLLLGWATLIQLNRPGAFPVDPFFFLIGVTYALSIAYSGDACAVSSGFRGWSTCSSATDAILVSGFIGLTGGIVSYFSSLYLLPIIAASIISFRRGAFQVAVLSGVLYLGLVTAQYLGAVPEWLGGDAVQLPGRQFAQYTIAINLSGFTAVALLSGSLAERLRHAQSPICATRLTRFSDLRAFNEYVIDGLLSGLVTTDAEGRDADVQSRCVGDYRHSQGTGGWPRCGRGPAAAQQTLSARLDTLCPDAQPSRGVRVPHR